MLHALYFVVAELTDWWDVVLVAIHLVAVSEVGVSQSQAIENYFMLPFQVYKMQGTQVRLHLS